MTVVHGEEHEGIEVRADEGTDEAAQPTKAAESIEATPPDELTFEQKVDHTVHLLLSNTLNRPTLYRILSATATEPMRLFDLEDLIQATPEFKSATQPPYFLIEWLVNAEALSFTEVDAQGMPITDEQREGKTEDEIDDLIEDMIIETTDVGREVLNVFDPQQRLTELLQGHPDRLDTYLEVLEFLTEKHSYGEVDRLLRDRPVLMSGRTQGDRPMQPSVFVDKLAATGSILYDDGWIITPEGRTVLEAFRATLDPSAAPGDGTAPDPNAAPNPAPDPVATQSATPNP
jgi:hypothetical protein